MTYVMAIDQGTTSSRTMLFNKDLKVAASAQREFVQHYPDSGWVEHEVEDLWFTVVETAREAMAKVDATAADIAAIGITNQRETTVVWEKATGKPLMNAIVWQDRRTADFCAELKAADHEELVTSTTGLLMDPYFSSTKLKWMLDHNAGARDRARAGELLFGTFTVGIRTVHFVEGHDDGHLGCFRVGDSLFGLRHHAIVGRDD
jgi:glycerol kinase